jgi:hypothetical protein
VSVGQVLDEAWTIYTKFFVKFFLVALIVLGAINVVLGLLGEKFDSGSAGDTAIVAVVGLVASVIGSLWLEGAFVKSVQTARTGVFQTPVGELFRGARPFVGRLFVSGLLAGLGVGLGVVLLIVPGLILLTWWSVIAPVIVIEDKSALESFGRSRELVRGNGWAVFGVVMISTLLSIIAAALVRAAFAFLPPFGEIVIGSTLAQAIVSPFAAIAVTVMYFRLRDIHHPISPGEAAA